MIELKEDPFLGNILAEDIPTLIGYFSATVREQVFTRKGEINLTQGKTKEALNKVDEVFRSNNQNYPINGKDGKQYLQLQLKLRGYKKRYPETKQNNISPLSSFANCFIATSLTYICQ